MPPNTLPLADFINNADRWPHFTAEEMRCKETNEEGVTAELMDKLEELRELCGFPLVVSSGFRGLLHSIERAKINRGKAPGTHNQGIAADIAINGGEAVTLLKHALAIGFTGIGINQRAAWANRFIHLDLRKESTIWSYK